MPLLFLFVEWKNERKTKREVNNCDYTHDNIKDYASNLTYLSFQKSCYNAFEALEYLNKHSIDLIFLDINIIVKTISTVIYYRGR